MRGGGEEGLRDVQELKRTEQEWGQAGCLEGISSGVEANDGRADSLGSHQKHTAEEANCITVNGHSEGEKGRHTEGEDEEEEPCASAELEEGAEAEEDDGKVDGDGDG